MANLREIAQDPDFQSLPDSEKMKALKDIEPDLATLPVNEQMKALKDLSGKKTILQKTGEILTNIGEKSNQARDWMIKNIPVAKSIRPTLELGGAIAGGIVGSPGLITAPAGTGLGYLAGKKTADVIEEAVGMKQPETLSQRVKGTIIRDIPESAIMAMTGPILGGVEKPIGGLIKPETEIKGVIPWTAEKLGKVIKPLWGRLTGTGTGTMEASIQSGKTLGKTEFDKALSGKITGEEVVNNAKEALNNIKMQRSDAYIKQLDVLPNQIIEKTPIENKLTSLVKKFGYKYGEDGKLETKYTVGALGKSADKDIREIVNTVQKFGEKEGDLTPRGLDTLKRYLDDFYSDSSNARAFVEDLKKTVHKTISDEVPNYKEMTKGYAEMSGLIKEIEQGLSLKKSGISGRITADQTLRRLLSSMRDNFELRKELVNTLGEKSGQDLSGQIAGYAMKSPIPVGLGGTGPIIGAEIMLARYVNPKFWPILIASSPRVAAEFLRAFGKASSEIKMAEPIVKPALGKITAENIQ